MGSPGTIPLRPSLLRLGLLLRRTTAGILTLNLGLLDLELRLRRRHGETASGLAATSAESGAS